MRIDAGPYPTQRSGQGGRCSSKLDHQLNCNCSARYDLTPEGAVGCTPVTTASTDTRSCFSRTDCIVMVAALLGGGILLMVVVIVVVVVVCVRRRRLGRQRRDDTSPMMRFSWTKSTYPVLEMQTNDTLSVTVSSRCQLGAVV